MSEAPEIKPCPFCGKGPTIQYIGASPPFVACNEPLCAAYCKTMLLSRWNIRTPSLETK